MAEPVKMYRIHVESFLRTDILGDEILLPYSIELDKAVLLINKLCGKQVTNIQDNLEDDFLSRKYQELKQNEGNLPKIKSIMKEINRFDVKSRLKYDK